MAERLQGLSIGLDLDSISLERSLSEIKRSFRGLDSSLKLTSNNLRYGEKSVDNYEKGIESLNSDIEKQRKNLDDLATKHADAVREQGENSRAAQTLAAEYNKQADNLNRLERQLENAKEELKKMQEQQRYSESGWGKLGGVLEGVGGKLKGLSKGMQDMGKNLTRKITKPAIGAASALGGIALVKGFDRLVGIDNAQAKLKGLGHDAESVEKIMESALESVKGTSFGMDEAATTAASAVAAGIEPGKELTRYLSIAGDAAAIAGTNLGEMGPIFNKIQTSNKAYNDSLGQLADRGLPIYQWLEEEMGLVEGAAFDMASKGEISSEIFLRAIEKNIGGAAQKIGEESFTAGMANMWAAVGRLGASFLDGGEKGKGFFSQLKPLMADFTEKLDGMGDFAEKAGVKFGEFFANMINKVKSTKERYDELSPTIQDVIKKVLAIGSVGAVAIGPILTIGSVFLGAIGNIMTGLAPLTKKIFDAGGIFKLLGETIKSVAGRFSFLLGPVGIAIGVITTLATVFTFAYKRSETFRDFVHQLGEKLKEVFTGIVDWITPGIEAIKNFFSETKERIVSFKNNEGAQLMKAFGNIGSFISGVAKNLWGAIKWAFDKIKWIIADYVMPVVEFIIKQVWRNIEGIITGALDVIMGAVKIFSGLFTGDFSKMWEGVKQLFFGAIKVIWNWIELSFVGRILKGVRGLASGFWGHIKNLWKWVTDTFKNSISKIYNGVRESFVGRIVRSIIDFAKNFRTNISNMWNTVKTNFTNKISEIRTAISNSFVGRMISSVTRLKDRFVGLAKDMWGGVKKQFNNIVDGAKGLPKRIGDGIRNAKDKAVSGMKSVGNSVIKWAGKPFNKVVDGVNWITGKLGIKAKIAAWDYPQYAKGTDKKGHPGGPAVVGEKGRELIKLPSGKSFISPGTDTLLNLPKGTHVIPNKQTEQLLKFDIPHYAKGTGLWDNVKNVGNKIKSGVEKTWDFIGDIWDYASNPSKLVNLVMDQISIIKDKAQIPTQIVKAGFNYVKTKPIDYVKGLFKQADGEGGGKPAFGWPMTSPFGYRMHPIHKTRKLHAGVDYGAAAGSPIPSTTGGTVSFAGWGGGFGNLVKVRRGIWEMFYAHMSKILVKTGQSVKKGDILGLVGSTGNSTGPHLHYETRKNGVPVNPLSVKGYAIGGKIDREQLAMVGEGNKEEMIIPLEQHRSRALGLWQEAGRRLGVSSRTMAILYNSQDGVVNTLVQVVNLIKEQTQAIINQNPLLVRIADGIKNTKDALSTKISVINTSVNQAKNDINQNVGKESNRIVSSTTQSINAIGKQISQTVGQAIKEVKTKIIPKAKPKANSNSITSRVNRLKQQGGSAASKYFAAVEEDGDWMNDWAGHVPESLRKELFKAGYDLAKSKGFNLGKNASKHLKRLTGYASGGYVETPQIAWLAEEGWPEFVIPTAPHRRTDAMKLLALAAKKIGANSGSYTRPSGIANNTNNDNQYLEVVVEKLTQQVQLLTELVISNQRIADKPVLSEGDIGRASSKYDSRQYINQQIFTGRGGP